MTKVSVILIVISKLYLSPKTPRKCTEDQLQNPKDLNKIS